MFRLAGPITTYISKVSITCILCCSTYFQPYDLDQKEWDSNKCGCIIRIFVYYHPVPKAPQFSSVPSLSCVWLFVTPWTAVRQASLSISNFRSLLKLMPIESVMPSNHLILCHPLLLLPSIFPSVRVFSNESSGGQSIGVSASTSVLPMNIQEWFPLGWTGWISLLSKGLSRVFCNTTVQKHQFFSAQLSL